MTTKHSELLLSQLSLYMALGVPNTGKGIKRVALNSLQNVDWFTRIVTCMIQGYEASASLVRSALLWLAYFRVRKHKKNLTVYFIFLYFHTDNSHFPICFLVCSCGLVKRHCPKIKSQICSIFVKKAQIKKKSWGVKYLSNFTWLLYLSMVFGDFYFIQEQFKLTSCTFTWLHFWRKKILFTPYNFILT